MRGQRGQVPRRDPRRLPLASFKWEEMRCEMLCCPERSCSYPPCCSYSWQHRQCRKNERRSRNPAHLLAQPLLHPLPLPLLLLLLLPRLLLLLLLLLVL